MSPAGRSKYPDHGARDYTLEILSAVMLGLATMASTWSAYQSTRWAGVQAVYFSQAAALRAEAVRKTNIVTQRIGVDIGLFGQYAVALSENNRKLADFLFERFPPELSAATKAWLERRPQENPDAPRSPFDMKEYRLPLIGEAEALLEEAEGATDIAKRANQTGDNYVLLTVLFASVLFFSGLGTKFVSFSVRVAILSFGGVILMIGLAVLMHFPVH